jgi:2-dehydro-3-deoxyphosphogluconate aldolase/(4S)-4-hydroxy-2-oxoglutarate aldolase
MRNTVSKANKSQRSTQASEMLDRIESGRIIAIVRGDYSAHIGRIADVLVEAGINALEITMNSPAAFDVIEQVATYCAGRLLVGAGTVMDVREVSDAANAGARFVVSPNRNARVIRRTKQLGLLSFPGALTCSEIAEAFDAGADAVKIFPAQMAPPHVVRALRAPLGDVRLIPTGGIASNNVEAYVNAGAWALGIGSELVNPTVRTELGIKDLLARAREFVAAARTRSPE